MKASRALELIAALLFGLLLVWLIQPHVDQTALRWSVAGLWVVALTARIALGSRERRSKRR